MNSDIRQTVRNKLADGSYKLVGKMLNEKTSTCWINFQVRIYKHFIITVYFPCIC